jgi:predicted chitinase
MLSIDQLLKIMPHLPLAKAQTFFPSLCAAMDEAQINTKLRIAAFLAQIAHESCELKWMEEIWGPSLAQTRYEPPSVLATRLGNTQKGDGYKYRGRGPIQLTGRSNYQIAGKALGLDLEANPDQVALPAAAFRVAGWYWTSRNINKLADASDFTGVTKAVNGGFNGLELRKKYYEKALSVL